MDGLSPPPAAPAFAPSAEPAFAMLDSAVRRFGPRPALDFLGRRWTYEQLGQLTNRAAAGLQKLGVVAGVNVGLCLPNTPYSVIMYHAILKAGGTVVNFNPLYTLPEIEAQAREADVSIMVSMDLALIHEKIGKLAAAGLFRRVIICRMLPVLPPLKALAMRLFKRNDLGAVPDHAPYVTFERLTSGPAQPAPVSIDPARHIAVLQFTGGTTGKPKAAQLTHANISVNVRQVMAVLPAITPGAERMLAVLPFFHVFAMTAVMNLSLSVGAEIILLPRLDLKLLMRTLHRRRPTFLPGVPTLFTAISNAAEASGKTDLSFIKLCVSGGAPLSEEVRNRFERISHCQLLEGYGLSETSPVLTLSQPGANRKGSVGRPLPGTIIEIRDPENPGVILPQGARGEICARGPQVMSGYLHQREDAQVFIDGALRTGDIGYLDADGYLFIVDRIKDLIICGGYNVYPRTIEEAAYQHPAVQEAIAIGVPDPYRGQAPKLFVTLRPGQPATPAQIMEFLQTRLNKIEMPRAVEIRDTLPRTMVGKLSKKELVAEETRQP